MWNVRAGIAVKLVLRWTEKNGPAVEHPKRSGFGTRIIETHDQGAAKGRDHH